MKEAGCQSNVLKKAVNVKVAIEIQRQGSKMNAYVSLLKRLKMAMSDLIFLNYLILILDKTSFSDVVYRNIFSFFTRARHKARQK